MGASEGMREGARGARAGCEGLAAVLGVAARIEDTMGIAG